MRLHFGREFIVCRLHNYMCSSMLSQSSLYTLSGIVHTANKDTSPYVKWLLTRGKGDHLHDTSIIMISLKRKLISTV